MKELRTTLIYKVNLIPSTSLQPGTKAYSEPCQTSKRKRFAKIVNG